MLFAELESSYERVDPDGTRHIWKSRLRLAGQASDVTRTLGTLGFDAKQISTPSWMKPIEIASNSSIADDYLAQYYRARFDK